ncbi:MAG TPA: hypothetical protein VIL35_06460 [Vicinamibacterales bacterium]
MRAGARAALSATCRREISAHRLNRFLHVHLGLAFAAGLLPLFTPDAMAGAAPWWVLQAVLYCLSLSSLLLGLSSAHGESDEFPLLFVQPAPRWAWLGGKVAALGALLIPASLLLIVPAALAGGLTWELAALAAAAGGVSVALATAGLALGFWVRDHVRGLLTALALWFGLLFGTDLLLLGVAGSSLVQTHPGLWVGALMANPLDALRITVLFSIEGAAPAGIDPGALAGWWVANGGLWLTALLGTWTAAALAVGLAGAKRKVDA